MYIYQKFKNMKKVILLSFLSSLIFLAACKKDNACNFDTAGIQGTWNVTGLKMTSDSISPEVDLFASGSLCDKDNQLDFHADGTYNYVDAGVLCSPASSDSGTWSVSGNNFIIDGVTFVKQSFSCNSLVIKANDLTTGGYTIVTLAR